jgi:SAM-dependent methyltransferase
MGKRLVYMAAEKDPLYLHALRNRFLRTPNVVVQRLDPEQPEDLAGLDRCFDTVLCLNVLEYLESPEAVLEALRATMQPGGTLIVLVPQNPGLYGSLDRSLGHKRRYTARGARQLLESCGFAVEKVYNLNKAGTLPWWAYSKLSGSTKIGKPVLKLFDKTVWLWSRLDPLIPWNGLSVILVARSGPRTADPLLACDRKQQTPASSN